jgi:hypothetical protein
MEAVTEVDQTQSGPTEGPAATLWLMNVMRHGQKGVDAARLLADARRAHAGDRDALVRLRVGAGWKPSARFRRGRVPRRLGIGMRRVRTGRPAARPSGAARGSPVGRAPQTDQSDLPLLKRYRRARV